jgi:hypothetical protein
MSRQSGWILCTLLAALPVAAPAQVTPPVWPKPDVFWYRKTVPGGNLWLKVDLAHGAKEPLFDHQRLAIELTLRTGDEYTPLTLPFDDPAMQFVVKYDGSNSYIQQGAMAIEFIYGSNLWRCDLQIKWNWNLVPPTDYECLSRRPVTAAQVSTPLTSSVTARVSPDGRWEAFIENHNVAVRQAGGTGAPIVLTKDGTEANAYQGGSILWSADSKSLSAYRVNSQIWQSEALTGNVKSLLSRGEWSVPGPSR